MFPREFKIKIIHNWVQIITPCSQGLARCHVTRQRCGVAPAPKLSETEQLLPSHRLRLLLFLYFALGSKDPEG